MRIAPCPAPDALMENSPGPRFASETVTGAVVPPSVVTVNDACVCPPSSQGIWKLICCGVTANNGAAMPFKRTVTPDSVVGSGTLLALALDVAKPVPNTEAIDPAASACCAKLAPFTVPFGLTVGVRGPGGVVPMTNVKPLDMPPPAPGLKTVTCAVPTAAISAAVIAAVN